MNIKKDMIWHSANKLRGTMDVADYKHVILGLIFLKYISDAFEPNEHPANNILWAELQAKAKQPNIGKLVDRAITAIEENNQPLKGVFPKNYDRPELDSKCLGELINLIDTIVPGDDLIHSKDILVQTFDYFLGQFARAEGKNSQFYTPSCITQLVAGMLAPDKGRVFDPCCGSGGMLVQAEKFIEAHDGNLGDTSFYGQELNPATWRLAFMNLAIHGINPNLGPRHGDSLGDDLHPGLEADYILANPPFSARNWGRDKLKSDKRWQYGLPPASNANFAWVQHFIHHLTPMGLAGFVLPPDSMFSKQPGEEQIRRNIIEADLVDCMVALPGQLYYTTQIPVCLWFVARDKQNGRFRDRRGETLFIDARNMGTMIDRVHRELTEGDINRILVTYHAWRGDVSSPNAVPLPHYTDVPGFCKASNLADIRHYEYILTPGRYTGTTGQEEKEPFLEKMKRLASQLKEQQEESAKLDETIKRNLEHLGVQI